MEEGSTEERRPRDVTTPCGPDLQSPWKVNSATGHRSPATLLRSHGEPDGKHAASVGPTVGAPGPGGRVPSARLPRECPWHPSILSFSRYGAGPKSRSRAAQEMCLQRMNRVFSLRK